MAIRTRGDALQIDVQVTIAGETKRHREKFVGDMASAKARETTIKAALMNGEDPGGPSPTGHLRKTTGLTIREALDNLMDIRWKQARNVRHMVSSSKLACEFFGDDTPLGDLTTEKVDEYVAHLMREGLKPSTISKRLNPLSVACNYYYRRGKIDAVPVFEKPSAKGNERTRLLSDAERVDIIHHFERDYDLVPGRCKEGTPSGRDYADLYIILQDTGVRPIELRRCRHQDLRGDILAVLFTKTNNPRHLPLTERALEAWQRQAIRHPDENPFAWATENRIKNGWGWIREVMCKPKATDPEFVTYLMRHDCATRLYALTRDLMLVRDWMGHKDISMTLRYAKLFPAQLEKARDMLNGGGADRLKVVA